MATAGLERSVPCSTVDRMPRDYRVCSTTVIETTHCTDCVISMGPRVCGMFTVPVLGVEGV